MSNYPTSLDDASSLYTPADAFSSKPLRSTLAVSCQADDTALQFTDGVVNVGGPVAYGIIRIDDEQILYTAASAGNVTGCTRGFAGTARVGHAAGSVVRWVYVAAFDQALQAAIIALENTIGITGAFNFSAALWLLGAASAIYYTAGSVGIGTATPAAPLDVTAPGGNAAVIRGNAPSDVWAAMVISQASGGFGLYDTSAKSYFAGSVGIGTTAPGEALEVTGNVKATGVKLGATGPATSIVTTLGSPGSDSNLATEKAIRTAIGSGASFVGCSAKNSAAYNIAPGSYVVLTFDTELYDTSSFHSTVSNTSRFTVPTTGYYSFKLNGYVDTDQASVTGYLYAVQVWKNGVALAEGTRDSTYTDNIGGNAYYGPLNVAMDVQLTAGDYVEFRILHFTAGANSLQVNPNAQIAFLGS